MAFNILISDHAQQNIYQAYDFYLLTKQSPATAQNFYNAVLDAFNSIAINPYYQIYHQNFRGFPLKNFPYIIFFEIDSPNNAITILAVFNTHQNTDKYPI